MLRAIVWCRGSSQECEDQRADVLSDLDYRGWAIVRYLDVGWSPAGARRSRTIALELIGANEADVLCVASTGLVCDGITEGVQFLAELANAGGHLHSLEGLNTWEEGPSFLNTCVVIASWASSGRSNRIRAGLDAARSDGKRLGRPPVDIDLDQLRALLAGRVPKAEIARRLRISRRSLDRAIDRNGLSGMVTTAAWPERTPL